MSVLSFTKKYGTVFYKALRPNLKHNDFTYKLGLNVDTNKFNPEGECSKGGLYFSDISNILRYIEYGPLVGVIEIPDDAQVYIEKHKFKADKILLNKVISDELEILEIFKESRKNRCPWNEVTFDSAAQNGHLEILKWLREKGFPWNKWTCSYAALNGHLDLLKWARENGCPWDELTCAFAALDGHLDLLKWARENGCPENNHMI